MGIELTCNTKSFGCSYSGWAAFRNKIVAATLAYLEDSHFDALLEHIQGVKDLQQKLCKQNAEDNFFESFITMVSADLWFGELLIEYGVAGLVALCRKSDCEGFYSVGNSVDICDLLIKIRPFLLVNKDDPESVQNIFYERTKDLLEVFEESVERKLFVRIH